MSIGKFGARLRRAMAAAAAQKTVSLQAWQRGQADAESIKRVDQLIAEGRHPLHALYTNTTNLIGIFMEGLVEFPFLDRVCRTIKTEEEKYMASYPPMSPITVSFYMHWILYDVTFGPDRETVAEWFLGVCDLLEIDPLEVQVVRQLCESRIGIFEARPGREGKHLLRELVTNREIEVLIPSGYAGTETALMLVRTAPPLPGMTCPHVALTTPYILVGVGEQEWMEYFGRQQIVPGTVGVDERLRRHLKHGPNRGYWPEYLFLGYVNYRPDRVFVTGLPDRPGTLPHHENFNPALLGPIRLPG